MGRNVKISSVSTGMHLMMRAATAFAVMSILAKYLMHHLPVTEVVFLRNFLGTLWLIYVMKRRRISFIGKNIPILVLRGISGAFALWLGFSAISILHLGNAIFLTQTAPVFASILGIFFLKERLNLTTCACVLAAFIGIGMLLSPQHAGWDLGGFYGIASGFFAAVAYLCVRSLRHTDSEFTIIFYFTLITTLLSFPSTVANFVCPSPTDWYLLISLLITSLIGQIHLTRALQHAPAHTALPFGYLTPIIGAFFGWLLWKETMSLVEILGAILTVASGILLYRFSILKHLPKAKSSQF